MCVLGLFWFTTFVCCGAVFIQQPMLLCVRLFFVAVSVCITLGSIVRRLLGFVVFMVYVSGVMVLFLYLLRVYPNEMFFVKYKFLILRVRLFIVISLSLLFCVKYSCRLAIGRGVVFDYLRLKSQFELFVIIALLLFIVLLVVCHLCMKRAVPLRLFK